MTTVPVVPSIVMCVPLGMRLVASEIPTTAGIPSSRAMVAAWLVWAPTFTTTPATARNKGVQAGSVSAAMRMSPGCSSLGSGHILNLKL